MYSSFSLYLLSVLFRLCKGVSLRLSSQVVFLTASHSCWSLLNHSELVSMLFERHGLKLGMVLQLMPSSIEFVILKQRDCAEPCPACDPLQLQTPT